MIILNLTIQFKENGVFTKDKMDKFIKNIHTIF